MASRGEVGFPCGLNTTAFITHNRSAILALPLTGEKKRGRGKGRKKKKQPVIERRWCVCQEFRGTLFSCWGGAGMSRYSLCGQSRAMWLLTEEITQLKKSQSTAKQPCSVDFFFLFPLQLFQPVTARKALALQITWTMSPSHSSPPVSNGSGTMSLRAQYQDPETEAATWNYAFIHVSIEARAFPIMTSMKYAVFSKLSGFCCPMQKAFLLSCYSEETSIR